MTILIMIEPILLKLDYFHSAWIVRIYHQSYPLSEVTNMDLFWSGLAQRASEHTRNERKSQFNSVHETAYQEIEAEKRFAEKCNVQLIIK
jgi:hypothetical protein